MLFGQERFRPIELLTGTMLGEYVVQQRVGSINQGSFRVSRSGVQYCAKVIEGESAWTTSSRLQRITALWREHEILKRIHPHSPAVVKPVEFFEVHKSGKTLNVLILEYIAGENLTNILAHTEEGCKPMQLDAMLDVLQQLAVSLDTIHTLGWTHRDVKPANIMVQDGTTARLVDFQLSAHTGVSHSLFSEGFAPPRHQLESLRRPWGVASDPILDIYAYAAVIECILESSWLKRVYSGNIQTARWGITSLIRVVKECAVQQESRDTMLLLETSSDYRLYPLLDAFTCTNISRSLKLFFQD